MCSKTLLINGINCQPQLVFSPDFWTINSMSRKLWRFHHQPQPLTEHVLMYLSLAELTGQITILPKLESFGHENRGGFPYCHAVLPQCLGISSETRQPWCPGNTVEQRRGFPYYTSHHLRSDLSGGKGRGGPICPGVWSSNLLEKDSFCDDSPIRNCPWGWSLNLSSIKMP